MLNLSDSKGLCKSEQIIHLALAQLHLILTPIHVSVH